MNKPKWLKILAQTLPFVTEICSMMGMQPWLTSSYIYDFTLIQNVHVEFWPVKRGWAKTRPAQLLATAMIAKYIVANACCLTKGAKQASNSLQKKKPRLVGTKATCTQEITATIHYVQYTAKTNWLF